MPPRMWLDALALALLLAFALLGARRGALDGAFRLFAWLAAYAAAVFGAVYGGSPVAEALDVPGLVGSALAGAAAFLAAYVGLAVAGRALRAWERGRLAGARGSGDRLVGAGLGVVRCALLVVLLGWAALWLDALRVVGSGPPVPDPRDSRVAGVTRAAVTTATTTLLPTDAASTRVAARVLTHPRESAQALQALGEAPSLRALVEDRLFLTYLEGGAVDAAMNRASFVRFTQDEALRGRLAELGLVDAAAAADPGALRAAVRPVLVTVGARVRGLRDDPEVQSLAADPAVREALAGGDALALLRHPGFRALVERLAASAEPAQRGSAGRSPAAAEGAS